MRWVRFIIFLVFICWSIPASAQVDFIYGQLAHPCSALGNNFVTGAINECIDPTTNVQYYYNGSWIPIGGAGVGTPQGSLGQGQVYGSGPLFQGSGAALYVDAFSGTDWCARVSTCLSALPSSGGICDARGLTGTQTCANGLALSNNGDTILVGNATVMLASTKAIVLSGNDDQIIGISRQNSQIIGTVNGDGAVQLTGNQDHLEHLYVSNTDHTHASSADVHVTGLFAVINDAKLFDGYYNLSITGSAYYGHFSTIYTGSNGTTSSLYLLSAGDQTFDNFVPSGASYCITDDYALGISINNLDCEGYTTDVIKTYVTAPGVAAAISQIAINGGYIQGTGSSHFFNGNSQGGVGSPAIILNGLDGVAVGDFNCSGNGVVLSINSVPGSGCLQFTTATRGSGDLEYLFNGPSVGLNIVDPGATPGWTLGYTSGILTLFHTDFSLGSSAQFNLNANTVLNAGTALQSTGGTAPTCACTGGSPTCGIKSGSTNNRGQIQMSGATSATTCTLTFSAAGTWYQAPFCGFFDGNASATPLAYSAGAISTSAAIVDFAAASAAHINYLCM